MHFLWATVLSETTGSGLDLLILLVSGTGILFVAEDLGVNSLALGLSGTNSLALGLSDLVLEQQISARCCSGVDDGDEESRDMADVAAVKAAVPQSKSEFTHLVNVPCKTYNTF